MMFRRSLVEGGQLTTSRGMFFDEDKSPLFEDVDLCLRAREQGLVVHIAGEPVRIDVERMKYIELSCGFCRGGSGYLNQSTVHV